MLESVLMQMIEATADGMMRVGPQGDILAANAAAARQAREALLDSFIEHAPAALAMFDRDMVYLAASRRWISDYGLTGREVRGVSHYEIFPEIPQRWRLAHQRGLAGEVISASEDRFERLDGSQQWLRWEIRPWHAADDQVGGIVIFTEDISERKHDELERKRAHERINQRRSGMERLLSQLVASQTVAAIAHDLNQPLSAVTAYSEAALQMLQTGQADPERLCHAIRSSAEQAQRAGWVLRELLRYMRKSDFRAEAVELHGVVETALSIVRADGGDAFETRIDEAVGCGPVHADRRQLEKVFVNLFRNGLEAMRAAGVRGPVLSVEWREANKGMLEIIVGDNGPGMAPDVARRAFDAFFTTKSEGVGMGLVICRSIIESHGGSIWIGAVPAGTRLHLTLPVST